MTQYVKCRECGGTTFTRQTVEQAVCKIAKDLTKQGKTFGYRDDYIDEEASLVKYICKKCGTHRGDNIPNVDFTALFIGED